MNLNTVLFVWNRDTDVVQVHFLCQDSEDFSVELSANLQSDDLRADTILVVAQFVLNPDGKWSAQVRALTWLDENVLALSSEVKVTTVK
jgi:hypothetical protein